MGRRWLVLVLLILCGLLGLRAETSRLQVIFASPQLTMVSPEDGVVVTFDQPMVALGPATERAEGPLQLQPAAAGKYRWLGVRTLAFYPTRLSPATTYRAIVPAATRSLGGASLSGDYTFTFHTRIPVLEESFGTTWSRGRQRTVLHFNMPMDPRRAAPFLQLSGGPTLRVRSALGGDLSAEQEWKLTDTLVVEPASAAPAGAKYSLMIKPGLLAREGDLGTEKKQTLSIEVPGPLRLLSIDKASHHDPGDPLDFRFNNPVRAKDLLKRLQVSPPARCTGAMEWSYPTAQPRLSFELRPDTSYTFTLKRDLADEYGYRLGRDVPVEVRTRALSPTLVAPVGARTLEAYLPAQLPLGFLNVKNVRVRGGRISREHVVALLQKFEKSQWAPPVGSLDSQLLGQARPNQMTYRPFELGSLLDGGFGLLALRFDPSDKAAILPSGSTYESDQRSGLVQVTRMGLTAKFSPDDVLVWVTDLENSASLAGTQLELRDANNKVRWKGQTDSDGLARAPGWQRLGLTGEARLFVLAQRGRDLAVIDSSTGSDVEYIPVERSYGAPAARETLLFTDRGLYRPGDEVHLKGIVRQRQGDRWTVPAKANPCQLTFQDSRDQKWLDKQVELSPHGSFDCSVRLPKEASMGSWQVSMEDGSTSFRVEAYRAAQFEVEVKPERGDCGYGDTLTAAIQARYLFGAPLARAPLKWTAMVALEEFTSPRWPGMQFGPDPWLDWRDREEDPTTRESLQNQLETNLDEQGRGQAQLVLRPHELKGPAKVILEARVTAVDQSEVSGRAVVRLHPASFYVGLRPSSSFVASQSDLDCSVLVISPAGQPQAGKKVELELLRREYRSVRRVQGAGSQWVSVAKDIPVGKTRLTSAPQEVKARLRTQGPGLYFLRGRSQDERGRLAETLSAVYVYGNQEVGWPQGDSRLELVPDKRSYKPGEVVRLAISSPFHKARALVTVERAGIMERFVSDVQGGAPVVRIPVRDEFAPNVFVSVALIQGRTGRNQFGALGEDLGRPTFRLGTVKIPVDSGAHRLSVDIKPDHEGYLPGQTATIDLQVRDAQGRGQSAEVTFVAADEGVLNLINYHLPDPMATFFRERGLSVETAETRHQVVGQRRYGEKGNPGGGGGEGASPVGAGTFRWNFEATPCWRPILQTDAEGRARVTFNVPDSLTAFRLSALAHTDAGRYGLSEGRIRVSRPLSMTSSWPRFCTIGDEGSAGVLVHNQTGSAGTVNVTLELEGADLQGASSQQVTVAAGESRQVRFPFVAARPGQLRFRFTSQMGSFSDALEATVPVQLPRMVEVAAARERVEEAPLEMNLEVPPGAVPGTARLDLAMSSSALAGLKPAVEYLRGYRYECLEQKVSRVLPMVAARDLVEAFGTPRGQGQALVQEVLDALPGVKTSSGGLSLWAGQQPNPWATAYALQLCARARGQGYKLPQSTIDGALDYVEKALADDHDRQLWGYPYTESERLASQAYMLATLAQWERSDAATLNRVYDRRAELSVAGQAWLLSTLKGRPDQAKVLARLLLDHLTVAAGKAHFQEATAGVHIYDSPTRSSALALEALLEGGYDFPQAAEVVGWLVDQREHGRWRTTQENAAVFSALSSWYRKKEALAPNFEASLQLAGREALRQLFQGHDLSIVSRQLTVPDTTVPLRMARQGSGTLHLSAVLRYASATAATPMDAGLSVTKLVEPVEGRPSPSGSYAPGTLLRVRLLVTNPVEQVYVVVNDPVAAGMEVVQSTFATERTDLPSEEDKPWWGGFQHKEIYDDRVLFFADVLSAGVHSTSYYVRAAYPGRYAMPPTLVEAMYAPEVYGRSAGEQVIIR